MGRAHSLWSEYAQYPKTVYYRNVASWRWNLSKFQTFIFYLRYEITYPCIAIRYLSRTLSRVLIKFCGLRPPESGEGGFFLCLLNAIVAQVTRCKLRAKNASCGCNLVSIPCNIWCLGSASKIRERETHPHAEMLLATVC